MTEPFHEKEKRNYDESSSNGTTVMKQPESDVCVSKTSKPRHSRTSTTTSTSESESGELDLDTDPDTDMDIEETDSESAAHFLPSYLSPIVQYSHSDFFVSMCFDPRLVAQLMFEGFLPISTDRYLIPKLHSQRCVIYPLLSTTTNATTPHTSQSQSLNVEKQCCKVHISRSTKKKMKRYTLSVNNDIRAVINGCHRQHGEGWLYPPITRAFLQMHHATTTSIADKKQKHPTNNSNSNSNNNNVTNSNNNTMYGLPTALIDDNGVRVGTGAVGLYSVEVWNAKTNKLAAGELGYVVGRAYTSLTGFAEESGAGSVQLAALGLLLAQSGFEMWDLGMDLDYKTKLGAVKMNRAAFLKIIKENQTHETALLSVSVGTAGSNRCCNGNNENNANDRVNCKDLLLN